MHNGLQDRGYPTTHVPFSVNAKKSMLSWRALAADWTLCSLVADVAPTSTGCFCRLQMPKLEK